MTLGAVRIGLLALGGLLLSLSAGSCGKVKDSRPLIDSNTNWLVPCMADDQCSGSLRCYCGQCTKPCGQDTECSLLSDAQCAESSEALCGESASPGGLCVRGCQGNEECGEDFSCTGGQCVPRPCSAGQCTARACGLSLYRSWDDVLQFAAGEVLELDSDDMPFIRFFTLGNESELSDPGTGVCEASLERKRQALSKLLNSLSIDPAITPPLPVDAERRLFRIDLRHYGWDRPVSLGVESHPDVWEALIANDPYALSFVGADADDLSADTGTSIPVLLVDSFIATATSPALYRAILAQPERLDQLLGEELGVPPESVPSFQAGFVEEVELLAQRWELGVRTGYVWSIAEFGRGPGGLFAEPLAAPLGERELIYSLPNGLQAFAFASAAGQLQDGWSVTIDPREPDRLARAPRSNWRRHGRTLAIRDQVRDQLLANEEEYGAELATLQQRFPGPEELALLLQRDASSLTRRALLSAGLDPDAAEPITRVSADFDAPVTLEAAAALLLLGPAELLDNLRLLDPALSALDGGTLPRSVFTELYGSSSCILSAVLENQPSNCP